ncbi:MAG: glycosyltransferase family 4 protein, partial [Candidatus Cloacimonadaceae bacterium]|nr:glycosyltransferase family 4 protein [Candidatus Cloacimonadaceae bacterium]
PALAKFFPSAIPAFAWWMLPAIKKVYNSWRPDIIHVHDYAHIPALYVLKFWLDGLSIPKFLSLHNLKSIPGLMNRPSTDFIYRITLKRALSGWSGIFCVNKRLMEYIKTFCASTSFIGNGIRALERISAPPIDEVKAWFKADYFHLLAVGNLLPGKGFDLLIEAVASLNEAGENCQLLILGAGEMESKLHKLITERSLAGSVWIHPPLQYEILRSLYYDFDAFVLPSYSETFGIVYLEAMYADIPVIGVVGQGIYGLFREGREALFCLPQDVNDLKAKILNLADNPSLRVSLAKAAKARLLKEFMLPCVVKKITQIYEENLSTNEEKSRL